MVGAPISAAGMCSAFFLCGNPSFFDTSLCYHENRFAKWFFDSLVIRRRGVTKEHTFCSILALNNQSGGIHYGYDEGV
jgi:hypothetical protein